MTLFRVALLAPLFWFACDGGKGGDTDDTDETDTTSDDTDTTSDDTDTTMTDDTDTMDTTPTCAGWCSALAASCSADPTYGFPSEAACNAYCAAVMIPAGTDADTSGNTLGCRTYHAGAAAMDAATHCPHASASGGSVCGSLTENYCWMADHICTGDNAITWNTDCATDAATYPTDGAVGATSGNSIQCRMYHLGAAL
ncbi:MAG TPA: hypothetical protein PKA64_25110, partial [Myxococcota bacterium]|nr:hypothetical protein [Myxococcota bacterium]